MYILLIIYSPNAKLEIFETLLLTVSVRNHRNQLIEPFQQLHEPYFRRRKFLYWGNCIFLQIPYEFLSDRYVTRFEKQMKLLGMNIYLVIYVVLVDQRNCCYNYVLHFPLVPFFAIFMYIQFFFNFAVKIKLYIYVFMFI